MGHIDTGEKFKEHAVQPNIGLPVVPIDTETIGMDKGVPLLIGGAVASAVGNAVSDVVNTTPVSSEPDSAEKGTIFPFPSKCQGNPGCGGGERIIFSTNEVPTSPESLCPVDVNDGDVDGPIEERLDDVETIEDDDFIAQLLELLRLLANEPVIYFGGEDVNEMKDFAKKMNMLKAMNLDNPASIKRVLKKIMNEDENAMMEASNKLWGDDYSYGKADKEQVGKELIGFLLDEATMKRRSG
jgi:hypothetical protein